MDMSVNLATIRFAPVLDKSGEGAPGEAGKSGGLAANLNALIKNTGVVQLGSLSDLLGGITESDPVDVKLPPVVVPAVPLSDEEAKSKVNGLLDDLLNAPPGEIQQRSVDTGKTLKSMIAAHPERKQAIVDALAQRYWKAGAETSAHRPLMTELMRDAGLSEDVGAALDTLAAANPQDSNLNAQHDSSGHQTTLSAADQVRGKSLPSIFPDRDAFGAALDVLGPWLTKPAKQREQYGNFSTATVAAVATMPLDDPRWDDGTIFSGKVPAAQRQTIKDAAATVTAPKNSALLGEVAGPDGMLSNTRIAAWKAQQAAGADGRINAFSQGGIGDCFLLSAVNAISKSPEGKRQIEKSISKQDGVYSIQLAGDPDHTVFTVTQAEVDAAQKNHTSSTGDADMIAFELGIEKYQQLHGATTKKGGAPEDILRLVTGRTDRVAAQGVEKTMPLINQAAAQSNGFTMTACCGVNGQGEPVALDDPTSVAGHAFAVTSIDLKTGLATLENPWDSSRPRTISVANLAAWAHLDYLPPRGADAAETASAAAQSAAGYDAEANAQAVVACGPRETSKSADAAAKKAAEAAANAAKASNEAQAAAALPDAGPEAIASAKAAAASAADAKAAADRAAEGARQNAAREAARNKEGGGPQPPQRGRGG